MALNVATSSVPSSEDVKWLRDWKWRLSSMSPVVAAAAAAASPLLSVSCSVSGAEGGRPDARMDSGSFIGEGLGLSVIRLPEEGLWQTVVA